MREKFCYYKEEKYSVRENGEIFRYSQPEKKSRPLDNKWTFGTSSKSDGYFKISGVPVHRIIATAYHGEAPSEKHVVDHIDTNRKNNRPENLRWLTRLENLILNPITAKRIINKCGSIEAFLENPSKYNLLFTETNFQWMRTVTAEEAKLCYERLLNWAISDKNLKGQSISSWALNHRTFFGENKISEITKARTPNVIQRNWLIPSEFPCCPQAHGKNPIKEYLKQMNIGATFCQNEIYSSTIIEYTISANQEAIYLISESTEGEAATKPWQLAKITYENDHFIHESLGSFFTKIGAQKYFNLAQGLEWLGENSFDDYI